MDSQEPGSSSTPPDTHQPPGSVAVGHIAPHVAVIAIRGEHDLSTEPALRAALEEGAAHSSVLVDLSECSFLDSTVVASLLRAAGRVQARGEQLALLIPRAHSQVRRVAEMTLLGEFLPIYTSREDALTDLTPASPSEVDA